MNPSYWRHGWIPNARDDKWTILPERSETMQTPSKTPTTTINGQVPLAPHEVSVNPGDGIPSITLTRFETGTSETYYLLPEAASALVSGLIGVTQPPPGEEWTIRKRAPAYPEYHTPEQVRQREAMASGCDPASVVVGSDRITFRQGETVVVLSRHPDGRWDMSGHRNTEGG